MSGHYDATQGFSEGENDKVADLSKSAIKKIIRAFNAYGADSLVARRRTGNGYLIGWNGIPS